MGAFTNHSGSEPSINPSQLRWLKLPRLINGVRSLTSVSEQLSCVRSAKPVSGVKSCTFVEEQESNRTAVRPASGARLSTSDP